MSSVDTAALTVTTIAAVVAVAGTLTGTFLAARVAQRHSVVDVAWGLLFAVIAVVAWIGSGTTGNGVRRGLLLVLPLIWGVRLAVHIARRTVGAPEDPRYGQLLERARGNATWHAVTRIYLPQGALAVVIASPILLGAFVPNRVGALAWVGVAIWAAGVTIEAVSDAQLGRYRAQNPPPSPILDSGLWRYSRHPNYFGDACAWWGMFLVACGAPVVLLTVVGPILMTLLLTVGSGTRLMERHMRARPGWAEYAARTSAFVPWPPRH